MSMLVETPADGIHAMLPRQQMSTAVRKMRDFYDCVPGAPLYKREFGYYCLEEWYEQGLDRDADFAQAFDYDAPAKHIMHSIGWCEAGLSPCFETKVLEDRGEHEVVQDFAGRHVLCFKGRRNGFMPEYIDHPVKDQKTWEELIKWRMDPNTPERWLDFDERMSTATSAAKEGQVICQGLVGGYMYLRSLIGPEDLLYTFYDDPDLIHNCMQTWLDLADHIIARHQGHVTLDEIFIGEDICYNNGSLISPDMIKEFLFPYYQQLVNNAKARQIDKSRHLYFQLDTDGFSDDMIPLYAEAVGMDYLSPFEVASHCDVVRTAQEYPDLLISGGIDKRILANGPDAIDRELDRIIPIMRARGGYIPTCDHGVPAEVSLENYLHYRKRCVELGG